MPGLENLKGKLADRIFFGSRAHVGLVWGSVVLHWPLDLPMPMSYVNAIAKLPKYSKEHQEAAAFLILASEQEEDSLVCEEHDLWYSRKTRGT